MVYKHQGVRGKRDHGFLSSFKYYQVFCIEIKDVLKIYCITHCFPHSLYMWGTGNFISRRETHWMLRLSVKNRSHPPSHVGSYCHLLWDSVSYVCLWFLPKTSPISHNERHLPTMLNSSTVDSSATSSSLDIHFLCYIIDRDCFCI